MVPFAARPPRPRHRTRQRRLVRSAAAIACSALVIGSITPATAAWRALELDICPMPVSNAPEADDDQHVLRRNALACVDGVELHVAPALGACLSSGFGQRSRNDHKGIDYHARPGVDVVAAAPGVIRELGYREKDFGHWLVLDHGNGVYTGYAHLENVLERMHIGATVDAGQPIGRMGDSGRAATSVHLHYEVRRGDFDTPRRWWGLEPVDPFAQPGSCAATGRAAPAAPP